MRFGAVGDIHGEFDALERVMARHPDAAFWVSVGDVASAEGDYPAPSAPLYFIKGNNEDFEILEKLRSGAADMPGLHYLPNGVRAEVDGVTVAALGGTFAPTWFGVPAADLPYPGRPSRHATRPVRDDKRRHLVREEVVACEQMRGVDVFLTHEAPRPFVVTTGRGGRVDAGKTPINEVLAAMRPRLHLFGHHHRFAEAIRQGVRSVGLDLVSRSYLLIDASTLHYEKLETASG